jgi:hypothetical protein
MDAGAGVVGVTGIPEEGFLTFAALLRCQATALL